MSKYKEDLALIHDEGFSDLAVNGSNELLMQLNQVGIKDGKILDLGCGGGVASKIFSEAGFSVIGIDTSQSLIEIARSRVPEAEFHVGSFLDFKFRDVVAVCAIGEVFNYTFDPRNSKAALNGFFLKVFDALVENGVFIFDVAGPERASKTPVRTFTESDEWSVLLESARNENVLTRKITTYRKAGELFRRDQEVHHLNLLEPTEILGALESAGFITARKDSYNEMDFPKGLHGYYASKNIGAT